MIKFTRKRTGWIGVDVGTSHLKVVQLVRSEKRLRLAAAVIVPERRSPHESAVLAKAASGALERVHLIRVANVSRALEALKHAGFWCVGLDAQAPHPLGETDLTGRIALVLGSEGRGLRRLVAENCDFLAALPMAGTMESLNVSAAAAIALYEATRQRRS